MNKVKTTLLALISLPLATLSWAANISTTTGLDANTPWIQVLQQLDKGGTVLTLTNPIVTGSVIAGYATTATAAGTTTLTSSSAGIQFFTGTTTQTVLLPVASTMKVGQGFTIENNSTGLVTVQSSGANTVTVMGAATRARFTCLVASGTDQTSWDGFYEATNAASGKVATFNNTMTFTGTDAQTYTLPSTSATLGRTDAAQTFIGLQTFANIAVTNNIITTAPRTTTATTETLGATDNYIVVNAGGTCTITLGTGTAGRVVTIKTIAAQTVVSASSNVAPSTSATLGTAILAGTAGKWARLVGDGTNWVIMESN